MKYYCIRQNKTPHKMNSNGSLEQKLLEDPF